MGGSTPRRLARILAGIVAALLLSAGGALLVWRLQHPPSEYRRFESPDGAFRVTVYSIPSPFAVMPGQGGDASGFVRLTERSGKVLQEKSVDMVNSIDQVEWKDDRVVVWLFAEWELPRERDKTK